MPLESIATHIVSRLQSAGFIAYFVGGWVRDFLMHHPSDDIDIATNAPIDVVRTLFPKTIPVGVAFGIIIVVEESHPFEVATFRSDHGYVDGRRPTGITPASPQEDAKRRDFTINGMFYDPIKKELFDYVGGKKDLERKEICAIGNPDNRFAEDRLRMMRAVRYSTRFNFTIEKKTEAAIIAHAQDLLPSVAMERIWQEFKKMAQFSHFGKSLVLLYQLNLLQTIFPALKGAGIEEIHRRVKTIPEFPKKSPPIAELLELFPKSSLEELLKLCDYLKLSREEKEFVTTCHKIESLINMPESWQEGLEKIEWARFYAQKQSHLILEILATRLEKKERESFLEKHRARSASLHKSIERIEKKNPLVRASDLIARGIVPGPKLGELLIEAERIAANSGLEDKESVLKMLLK